MRADELRCRYLDFFQSRDHKLFPSDSLVPEGDASVLFTGAGMNQFKDAFLGKGPKDLTRACSSQKCLRMPDLDNVGRTPSHHTFFEMLGNFSFGDYFKREAITWAMEFLEGELGLPRERLGVSVYLDDDEAADIWHNEIGIAKNRIWRYGEEDNFWPAEAPSKGPNGPCGPCSEIYFDFGPKMSATPDVETDPATDSKRYVEVWNLVFTQFERVGVNELKPLPRKNIDTGMGLERIVRVMQEKATNFETDIFVPILEVIGELCGKRYGKDAADDRRMRRIADHVRAATFCIGDGVMPGNEGRGYIVRKVIRRAGMDLRELGCDRTALRELVPTIAQVMSAPYPELKERQSFLQDTIGNEEDRFAEVYRTGTEKLKVYLDELDQGQQKRLPGEKAFFLWDTVGFPFDITRRYCEDHGYQVDEAGFEKAMDVQRARARDASQMSSDIFGTGPASKLKGVVEATRFLGYDGTADRATIVAMIDESGAMIDEARRGQTAVLVLDQSPFYAESGGQVGDTGVLTGGEEASSPVLARVDDTKKAEGYHLHGVVVESEALRVGDSVFARVDRDRRLAIMRNHTATHLLHWALRRVLGESTTQAGSLVHPDYLRFDYTARNAPTPEQLIEIEDLVNAQVLKDLGVGKAEKSYDEARSAGAIALFGEKYGSQVRVISVLDAIDGPSHNSVELCGGTHCDRTGQIGLMKIVSDGAIAAGVRRIIAQTGVGALRAVREKYDVLREVSDLLKVRDDEMARRVSGLLDERSRLEKELARLKKADALASVDAILADVRPIGDLELFVHRAEGLGPDELLTLSDKVAEGRDAAVVLLTSVHDGKVSIVARAGKAAIKRGVKAGDLCRELGKTLGGGGGGRPDMAQGQGRNPDGLDAALTAITESLTSKVS